MSTPASIFPAAIVTDAQLKVANNLIQTSLSVGITSTNTVLFVASTAGFVSNCLISIDNEILAIDSVVSGPNPSLIVNAAGRGFDGTAAASHSAGAKVSMFIDAWHHNALAAEVKAIEGFLGPNGQNIAGSRNGVYLADDYDWTRTPGGSLITGLNTITLSPAPPGTAAGQYMYITGGTGAAEAVPVSSWNPATGAAIINCANAHSGAWTISSASDGIQEAVNVAASNGTVTLKGKTYNVQGTILVKPGTVISGSGKADQLPATYPGGTTIDASGLTAGYVFDYLSAVQTVAYGLSSAFVFQNFSIKTGLNGIRLNNDTAPTGTNYQAHLTDNIVIENVNVYGGSQYNSDPSKLTNAVPTLASLKAYGVGFNLSNVFRVRVIDCGLYFLGVPVLIYGDENLIEGCLCSQSSIGVWISGKDPNSNAIMFGNKNIIRHVKFQGLTRLPAIWTDWCGGTYVENCYFELSNGAVNQYVRVTNGNTFTFGPNNWVQSPFSASSAPSFHIDVQSEALIHNNTMLQGPNTAGQIEMDYHQYQAKYPNIVRMWGNGSYFPQPGNRSWLGGGNLTTFPMIPGILVSGQPNSLLLNAYNNPGDWAYNSAAFPWVLDATTNRWIVNSADATIAANGFGAWFRQLGRLYRTFTLSMSARSTGTGQSAVNIVYEGNAITTLLTTVLTFATTAETSVQSTANFSIPAGETLGGSIRVNFTMVGLNVEQVQIVPVS